MLGPSGERTGQILPYCEELMSRIEKEALSREIPPVPITVKRLRLSISAKGLVWSRMDEMWYVQKNSFIEAIIGCAFIKWLGENFSSVEARDIFSLTILSNLSAPTRKAIDPTSSPIERMRRFDRWSMSST